MTCEGSLPFILPLMRWHEDVMPGNVVAILGAWINEPIHQTNILRLPKQNGWKDPKPLMTRWSHVIDEPYTIFTCYNTFSLLFKPLLKFMLLDAESILTDNVSSSLVYIRGWQAFSVEWPDNKYFASHRVSVTKTQQYHYSMKITIQVI